MKTIALIPIDNRSVCYELPKQIIDSDKEYNLLLPPKEYLGDLTKYAKNDEILSWLKSLKNPDIIVISLDTAAYGGLISSRRSNDSFKKVKQRIDKLVNVINKFNSKVYAFSSIMRISDNNVNEEEKEYWNLYGKKIFNYSFNLHKSKVLGEYYDSKSNQIPDEILNDYLNTRKRNFEINKYYIDLKNKGVFDTLVFSKDDCAQYGLNVEESELLEQYAKSGENIYIKTGADEIPLSLISRAINKEKKIKICPVYTNKEGKNKISKYEDIDVEASVNSQIELCGAELSDETHCDLIMLVNNFKTEQGELVMGINVPLFEGNIDDFDKPYFICDILNANGSDNNFVQKAVIEKELKEYYGYSGWNTTGNTLGCGISMALTYYKAKKPDNTAFNKLNTIRLLDDWAYQANVRGQIRDKKENLYNNIIKEKMSYYEKTVLKKFNLEGVEVKYSFPWDRFFEIRIDISSEI